MNNSEYWKTIDKHNAKRQAWQDKKVDKAMDIPPPANKTTASTSAYLQFLDTLEIGDSFTIQDGEWKSGPGNAVTIAKKHGKKLTSRKIYHDDHPDEFHYRVWYIKDIDPVKREKPRKHYDVVHRQDPAIGNFDAETGRLPNDILFLAEQNEENREIVEDIRRLNRILIEELGKQNLLPKQGE